MKPKIELNANAISLRRKFGEDASSPIDIFSMINNVDNYTLVFHPMSDRLSGMCIRTKSGDSVIAINSTLSFGRQRFTAAHELYHLNFQDKFSNVICGKDIGLGKDVEERNADVFASYFLAPYEALSSFIEDTQKYNEPISLDGVIKIEQHFGMSRQATLYRLKEDGFITEAFANTLKSNIIRSAKRLGYDDHLYIPTPDNKQYITTGSYIQLVEQLKEKEIISHGKYEELLLDAFRSDIVYNLNSSSEERYD